METLESGIRQTVRWYLDNAELGDEVSPEQLSKLDRQAIRMNILLLGKNGESARNYSALLPFGTVTAVATASIWKQR